MTTVGSCTSLVLQALLLQGSNTIPKSKSALCKMPVVRRRICGKTSPWRAELRGQCRLQGPSKYDALVPPGLSKQERRKWLSEKYEETRGKRCRKSAPKKSKKKSSFPDQKGILSVLDEFYRLRHKVSPERNDVLPICLSASGKTAPNALSMLQSARAAVHTHMPPVLEDSSDAEFR